MLKKVEVVPPDRTWRDKFEQEAKQVAQTLGENVIAVHHIGSTSIPNIYAKPIVDMLVEVKDIHQVEARNAAMESLGYTVKGEFGIPGRRYFTKAIEGTRIYHVHTFQTGSAAIIRHLAFRDYMIAHPQCAQQYSDLKRSLAQQFPTDIESYMDGKDGFIKEMERNALEWRASHSVG